MLLPVLFLELIAKIYEKVWFLGVITVADAGTQGAEYGIVVIGSLNAKENRVIKELPCFACL